MMAMYKCMRKKMIMVNNRYFLIEGVCEGTEEQIVVIRRTTTKQEK
jgi:hypothetical protein